MVNFKKYTDDGCSCPDCRYIAFFCPPNGLGMRPGLLLDWLSISDVTVI